MSPNPDVDDAVARAVEIAIADRQLPAAARNWGKVVLLEELAGVLSLSRNTLRNYYYKQDPRLQHVLAAFVASNWVQVESGLRGLPFRAFPPLVWKRTQDQLLASRRSLPATIALAQAAATALSGPAEPPATLRRQVGSAAAEIMACALTFFDGGERWHLLQLGEALFVAAMAPLTFGHEIAGIDASLFARFWENRATRCGLEWSNVWDDPQLTPTAGPDLVTLAIGELENAAVWVRRRVAGAPLVEHERLRQLLADKAKWLAKAGQFAEAHLVLAPLTGFQGIAARSDILLLETLEQVAGNQLDAAARSSGELAEMLQDKAGADAVAPAASAILVHNVDLLRGRQRPLPEVAERFLVESPVQASEMVNLPRYRQRLAALGYAVAGAGGGHHCEQKEKRVSSRESSEG